MIRSKVLATKRRPNKPSLQPKKLSRALSEKIHVVVDDGMAQSVTIFCFFARSDTTYVDVATLLSPSKCDHSVFNPTVAKFAASSTRVLRGECWM